MRNAGNLSVKAWVNGGMELNNCTDLKLIRRMIEENCSYHVAEFTDWTPHELELIKTQLIVFLSIAERLEMIAQVLKNEIQITM